MISSEMCIRITRLGDEDQYGSKSKRFQREEKKAFRNRSIRGRELITIMLYLPKKKKKNKFKRYSTKHRTTPLNAQSKLDAEKNPNTKFLQGAKVPCRYYRRIDNMILMQASLGMGKGFPDSIVQDESGENEHSHLPRH